MRAEMNRKVKHLRRKLAKEFQKMVPADNPEETEIGWPSNFGGYLTTGWCQPGGNLHSLSSTKNQTLIDGFKVSRTVLD